MLQPLLAKNKYGLPYCKYGRYHTAAVKSYNQYCPIAHALDLVGERWALLIVRELIEHGQLRYSDLHANLAGCATNSLAARLKDLERNEVVRRRRLPPPAASTVYELTEYGQELRPVMHLLAHWGARSLHPPTDRDELEAGWLHRALQIAFPENATQARIEFRVGEEIASFAGGEAHPGPVEGPDAVVECDPVGFYHFVVDRELDGIAIAGDAAVVAALLERLPSRTPALPAVAAVPASA